MTHDLQMQVSRYYQTYTDCLMLTCLVPGLKVAIDTVVVLCLLYIPIALLVIAAVCVRTHHRTRAAVSV